MTDHAGVAEHLPPFLAAIDLPQSNSASDILSANQLAYTGALFVTVTPEKIDGVLKFLRDTAGRSDVYLDVSTLPSTQDIVDLLDGGAAKVFVASGQVPALQEVPNLDSSRIVYHPTVSAGEAEDQLSGTGFGLYLHNVQNIGAVGSILKAMGKTRPAVYVSKEGMREAEAVKLRTLNAVPIVGSHQLTVAAEPTDDGIRVASLLLAKTKSDRADGLFTTLVTDERGIALGLIYSNEESVAESLRSGRGVYWSRKRGLWRKGDTSGDWQELVRIETDCDDDCLRFVVRQQGSGFCHLLTATCFGEYRGLSKLQKTLQSRKRSAPEGSYTARLFNDSKMLNAKIMEEASELCEASSKEEIAAEAADVLYFALTKATAAGVTLEDIERNLDGKSVKVKRRKGDAKGPFAEKFGVVTNGTSSHTNGASTTNGAPTKDEVREAESQPKSKADAAGLNGDGRIQMRRYVTKDEAPETIREALKRPSQRSTDKIMAIVRPIINDVREQGDKALLSYTHKFEKATSLTSPVLKAPFPESLMQLPPETIEAIDISFENIRKFHAAQREEKPLEVETMPGVVCSRFVRPIERVGLYVPGGTAVLPSTALMLGVPAMVAGCKTIVLASPPRADGKLTPEIVYVAHKVGAESIVLAGGAQAVAAMAHGTESVSKVDKILGPGNQFVTAAKMLVSNDTTAQVSIDMPAGPSEVLVIADKTALPAFVASDLLSQAEHGVDSQVVCIAVDLTEQQVRAIEDELHAQATALPRVDMVRGAISHSVMLVTRTLDEALELSNAYAPEHLILQVADSIAVRERIMNAGSVFCGPWTPESVGDYSAGVNHSLPTYGPHGRKMLKAVFYARFHPERGPSVVHQYPNGSIIPAFADQVESQQPLVSWSDVSAYVIPPYEVCNRPFSICAEGHRILGFPVSLEDPKYERNRFTFNVCFVLNETEDVKPWLAAVNKTVAFFQALEEEDGLLQTEEDLPGLRWAGEDGYPAQSTGVVYKLLKSIVEDLNTYEETCIRLNSYHVLNLRLVHPQPPPPKVQAWDVPLLIRDLPSPEHWTWDLTLQRIHPYLDGVNPIQRIAELADVELKLVKRAVRELVFHHRALLLDLFHFQAIYTPTKDFAWFVADVEMQEECARYVALPPTKDPTPHEPQPPISASVLITLYTSLAPSTPLHSFVQTHYTTLLTHCIDIRRLITFGTTKGFLRRIYRYALALDNNNLGLKSQTSRTGEGSAKTGGSSPAKSKSKSNEDAVREFERAWKRAAMSSGWATPPAEPPALLSPGAGGEEGAGREEEVDEKLRGFLDGRHCFDEMRLALRMSERELLARFDGGRLGEVLVFNK
ncbi:trifunctional histidinol dehydrogenase [Friedmanniomyces endolithicus]|nr:trifunctional histidinol dehydrogenase [Friedmanniomyces endolithicus]